MRTNSRYSIIKSFLPSILVGLAFMILLLVIKPPFAVLLLVVFLMSFIIGLYLKHTVTKSLEMALINSGILTALHFLVLWLGVKGVLYVTLLLVLIPLILIARRWKLFIKTLGDIEEEFFGRRFK